MSYPSILQYVETLSNPRKLLKSLGDLNLLLNNNNEPIYSSGNFGAVFKVEINDQTKAIKCFTREQAGRKKAYTSISDHFKEHSSYTIDFDYLDKEIGVFHDDGTLLFYPVVLMDWVEGETMDFVIHKAALMGDRQTLGELSCRFDSFAMWLLSQPFAHGDLKPENIIISESGEIVLIDYDGAFIPSMEGDLQREIGTRGFQHPDRGRMMMGKAIDDYSIAIIATTLRVLTEYPHFYAQYGGGGSAIFDPYKILDDIDPCYNFLQKTKFAVDPLFKILRSQTAEIKYLNLILGADMKPSKVDHKNSERAETESLKKVVLNGRVGFVDGRNNFVIDAGYDAAYDFVEGYAIVCVKRRWGVVDQQGRSVVKIIYDQVRNFSEGLFAVSLNGKWGYVGVDGRNVIPLKYDNAWSFRCGRGLVQKNGKYGFVNEVGKVVISTNFEYAQSFIENYACVKKDGLYGFLDVNGKWAQLPIFTYAQSVQNGRAKVEKDGLEIEIVVKDKIGSVKKFSKILKDQK